MLWRPTDLRFERFYANAPVCSPTRAGILTGRSNNRTGVLEHGYNLNLEEKTFVQALRKAGFATGHFGKWHLNGIRGPGVPILKDDPYHPGKYGFSHWMTSTNFIDYHPLLSEMGRFDQTKGDASEVIVDRALAFIDNALKVQKPSLSVIWYGAPHSPWIASETDRAPFAHLPIAEQHHYGELVAMDRSIGALRGGLRKLGIEDDTLIWFSSDNGGLRKNFGENAVGPLRGGKKELWEGGGCVFRASSNGLLSSIRQWSRLLAQPSISHPPLLIFLICPGTRWWHPLMGRVFPQFSWVPKCLSGVQFQSPCGTRVP